MDRGHAISKRSGVEPVLLRDNELAAHRSVPVSVDEPGHDRLAGDVDCPGSGRIADRCSRPDRGDPVAFDKDGTIFDHFIAAHRDDARTGERDAADRLGLAGSYAQLRDELQRRVVARKRKRREESARRRAERSQKRWAGRRPAIRLISKLREKVCELYRIQPCELRMKTHRPVVVARQLVMLAAREAGIPFETIALTINRHHATVIHGCEQARRLVAEDLQAAMTMVLLRDVVVKESNWQQKRCAGD